MESTKPFLILQLRPEDETSESEFAAFMKFGNIDRDNVRRVRLEKEPLPSIHLADYSAVIVGGGPYNVSDSETKKPVEQKRFERELHQLLDKIIEVDFPFLGACYGLGILAQHLGGEVSKKNYSEGVGAVTVLQTDEGQKDLLLKDLPESFRAFGGHKEACQELPSKTVCLLGSETCPVHMIRYGQNVYGTQFHTELDTAGLILRINTYKHAGYFPPEDAAVLIAAGEKEHIITPMVILRRFVERYSTTV